MTARRRRRLLVLACLAALLAIGWWLSPRVGREIAFAQVDRAIAAGRFDEAEARLDRMIAAGPGAHRAQLLRVAVARKQGRITEAEEILQRAVELGLPVEQGRREHALLTAGRDFAQVEPTLRRLLEANPDDEEVRRALIEGRARLEGR